jgi:uncharacterized protein (UPF0332 family)
MNAMHTAEVKANIERAEQAVKAAQKLFCNGFSSKGEINLKLLTL